MAKKDQKLWQIIINFWENQNKDKKTPMFSYSTCGEPQREQTAVEWPN